MFEGGRSNSIRKPSSQITAHRFENCPLEHIHHHLDSVFLDCKSGIEKWLGEVESKSPLSMLSSTVGTAKYVPVKAGGEAKKINTNGLSFLLLRICDIKMMIGEERSFQIMVCCGSQVLYSCPSRPVNGGPHFVQDYFLINLKSMNQIDPNMKIEIHIIPYGHSMSDKMKSFKSAASELLRRGSVKQSRDSIALAHPSVAIPMGLIVAAENNIYNGRLYISSFDKNNSMIVGEIALQILAHSDCFKEGVKEGKASTTSGEMNLSDSNSSLTSSNNITYQKYITIPANSHQWRRVYGCIKNRSLYLQNPLRHQIPLSSPLNLKKLTEVNFDKLHKCGLENVITLSFEDEQELIAYADSAEEGVEWANAISTAVWNQPYISTA